MARKTKKVTANKGSKPTSKESSSAVAKTDNSAANQNKKHKHKTQLDSLKAKDPEFYAYLQENDAGLLDFNESGSDTDSDAEIKPVTSAKRTKKVKKEQKSESAEGSDEDSGEDVWQGDSSDAENDDNSTDASDLDSQNGEDEDDTVHEVIEEDVPEYDMQSNESGATVLTSALLVPKLKLAFSELNLQGLRDVLHAFRAACRSAASDQSTEKEADGRYRILSATVFNRVVVTVLTNARAAIAHHLKGSIGRTGAFTEEQLRKCQGFSKVASVVQSLLTNILLYLPTIKDAPMLLFVLRSLRLYIPFFGAYPKLARKLVKTLLVHWEGARTRAGDDSDNVGIGTGKRRKHTANADDNQWSTAAAQQVMAVAFLRLRQSAIELPYPTIDAVLKGIYLGYVRAAKFVTDSNRFWLTQMGNCVVEMWGIDSAAGYQHAFVYVRQLALHLRSALAAKTEKAIHNATSWQFVNCCRAWTAVLCCYAQNSEHALFSLVYPLCQIIIGTLRLTNTPRYWYIRLRLISMLNDIQWATGVYVPVAIPLLEILRSAPLQRKPSGTTLAKPPPFATTLKLSQAAVSSKVIQTFVVEKTVALLADHLKANSASVAFPELALPVQLALRGFAKKTKVATWRTAVKDVIEFSTTHGEKIAHARAEARVAPARVSEMAAFQARAMGMDQSKKSQTPAVGLEGAIGAEYRRLREARVRKSSYSIFEQRPGAHALNSASSSKQITKDEDVASDVEFDSDGSDELDEEIDEQQRSKKRARTSKAALTKPDTVQTLSLDDF